MSEQASLSYDQAMALIVRDAGVKVNDVHASLYRSLLYRAAEQSESCNDIKAHLRGLLLRYRIDRYEALRILERFGVDLNLVVVLDDDGTSAQTDVNMVELNQEASQE
jgi:hypothetical protein